MRVQRLFPWFGAIAIWTAAIWGLLFILAEYGLHQQGNLPSVVGYFAALLALAGWMVQAFLSVRSSRKQHSINVLFQSRMSPEYQKNLKAVNDAFPSSGHIDLDHINLPENRELYNSVAFVLNYYEFISVGIWHGDLDHSIMRDCIRSQFLTFTRRARDVIRDVRKEDDSGKPSPDRQLTFQALCRLRHRWQADYWRVTGTWPRDGKK